MRTRKAITIFFGILFFTLMANPTMSSAEMSINIGIGVPLPQVIIHDPPPVVVIPGTYVYFAPDVGVDIFFYHGYWYRPHRGHWYRGRGYDGPWDNIRTSRVPHVVRDLPPDFRHTVRHHERIRHANLQRNWKTWEQKKHWDRRHYRHRDRHDYGQGARGVHDRGKREINHGRPDSRHEIREVRNVRDGGRPENNLSRSKGKGRHER